MKAPITMLTAVALLATPAMAQERVDRTVASAATGEVEIQNTSGSVRVVGWNRPEIRITGTLGRGTERLDVEGGPDRTRIRVVIPRGARDVRGTDLEIRVPAGKSVAVRTVSADFSVDGVTGAVQARTVSGAVSAAGQPASLDLASTSGALEVRATSGTMRLKTTSGAILVEGAARERVDAESVSGSVTVTASTPEVRAKAVSGDLVLRGVSGRASTSTVSGKTSVLESRVQHGSFESVSGDLRIQAEPRGGGALDVRSHSGTVEMILPPDPAARVEVRTFSGRISSEFGGASQRSDRGPGESLILNPGGGSAGLVKIDSFSGAVKLIRR